jgi:hypothetical protein
VEQLTRESILATRPLDRPKVLVRYSAIKRYEDGPDIAEHRQTTARIDIDEGEPWACFGAGGASYAFSCTWDALLESLNACYACPLIYTGAPVVYEC